MMIDQLEKKGRKKERRGNRFRKGRSILMEFLYRQMLVMVVLFFFFFTTGHNPCRTMRTEQSNYDRVRWCWRLKLVLWVTVAPVSDFLNTHIREKGCSSIGLTSIQWLWERENERRRMKELFLLLLLFIRRVTYYDITMRINLFRMNVWWFVLLFNFEDVTNDLVMIINLELCDTRRCTIFLFLWVLNYRSDRKKFFVFLFSLGNNQSIWWKISLERISQCQ